MTLNLNSTFACQKVTPIPPVYGPPPPNMNPFWGTVVVFTYTIDDGLPAYLQVLTNELTQPPVRVGFFGPFASSGSVIWQPPDPGIYLAQLNRYAPVGPQIFVTLAGGLGCTPPGGPPPPTPPSAGQSILLPILLVGVPPLAVLAYLRAQRGGGSNRG